MEKLAQDRIRKQAERILFVCGFQKAVELVSMAKTDMEEEIMDAFLVAAIQDGTDSGFTAEA